VQSSLPKYTFDAAVLTAIRVNAPSTGTDNSARLTVIGLNFGGLELTPSAAISGAVCSTSTWTTTTSVKCAPRKYGGQDEYPGFAQVSVTTILGTGLHLPSVSHLVAYVGDRSYRSSGGIAP
jgi:hypothetical protein